MEELLEQSPAAHHHLSQIDDPDVAESIGSRIGKLTHESLIEKDPDAEVSPYADIMGVGTKEEYIHTPVEEHNREQSQRHLDMQGLILEAARLTSEAHKELPARSGDQQEDVDLEVQVFEKAQEIALREAEAARDEGNKEVAESAIKNILVMDLLMGTEDVYNPYDVGPKGDLQDIVSEGLEDELLGALQDLHGVVTFNDRGAPVSVAERATVVADVLRIATDTDFDDQFQHVQPLSAGEIPTEKADERRQEISQSLDPSDYLALASSAREKHDKEKAVEFSKNALSCFSEGIPYGMRSSELADILAESVGTIKQSDNPSDIEFCQSALDGLRDLREPGNYFRVNSDDAIVLDPALVELASRGNEQLVRVLISSSSREMDENLDSSIMHSDLPNIQQVRQLVARAHQEKAQHLGEQLRASGASESIVDSILTSSVNPDTALNIPQEFWGAFEDLTYENQKTVLESLNINGSASSILEAYSNGISPDLVTKGFIVNYPSRDKEKRHDYAQSYASVAKEIQGYVESGDIVQHEAQEVLSKLSKFNDPRSGMQLAKFFSGVDIPTSHDISTLASALNKRNKQRIGAAVEISPDFINDMQAVSNNPDFMDLIGLDEDQLLHGNDVLRTDIMLQIIQSEDLSAAADELVESLKGTGLVDLLGENGAFYNERDQFVRSILRSDRKVEDATELREIFGVDTEISTILGENGPGYNLSSSLIVHIMHSKNKTEAASEITSLLKETELVNIIGENGLGYAFREQFINSILGSENKVETAKEICRIFEGGTSLWHASWQMSHNIVSARGFYSQGAKVSKIPISLPASSVSEYSKDLIQYAEGDEMFESLEQYGVDKEIIEAARLRGAVEITDLPDELQQTLLAAYLYEAISMSRDVNRRQEATERNKNIGLEDIFSEGSLHHCTKSAESLDDILQNGLLPGELIVDQLRPDAYPFNVDLVEAASEVRTKDSQREKIDTLGSISFAGATGIVMHIVRNGDSQYRVGAEFPVNSGYNQHRLIPGGFPATEISAVTLIAPTLENQEMTKNALLEAGIFIPVFDQDGNVLYSYDQYEADRTSGNYDAVTPEIVDMKFKQEGSQAGSNEGAEFVIPGAAGEPPERYYCKFVKPNNAQHLWSELITDGLYRATTPELIPETRAVIIEGRLARASKIVTRDGEQRVTNESRNEGFLMDCLVGNWDAVYNNENLVMSNGRAMRIDTGNALSFRARGELKPEGSFDGVVQELENGSDTNQLGTGMRQMYPELTIENVVSQAETMQHELTDERIDQIVDGVRYPSDQRVKLKQIIKQRRDYILQWAEEIRSGQKSL